MLMLIYRRRFLFICLIESELKKCMIFSSKSYLFLGNIHSFLSGKLQKSLGNESLNIINCFVMIFSSSFFHPGHDKLWKVIYRQNRGNEKVFSQAVA